MTYCLNDAEMWPNQKSEFKKKNNNLCCLSAYAAAQAVAKKMQHHTKILVVKIYA